MSSLLVDRPTVTDATRRGFLTLVGAAGLLTACSSAAPEEPTGTGTRTVQHPLGSTEVPVAPARVVALDRRATLPHLLALGVTPVGALTHESIIGSAFPPVLGDRTTGITVVPTAGGADDVSLEAVAALQPDLMIGWTDGITDTYTALSRIAPTVAVDVDFTDASGHLRGVAAAVGREQRAETVIADFERRRTEAVARLGEIGEVSVILSVGSGTFRVYSSTGSSVARWLDQAGGRIGPAAQTLTGEPYEDMFVAIGPENLGQVTGSTLVVMRNTGAAGEAALAELEGSPLWPTLPAVQAGRVVRINSQESVGSYGFQGYDAVLDTLVREWPT